MLWWTRLSHMLSHRSNSSELVQDTSSTQALVHGDRDGMERHAASSISMKQLASGVLCLGYMPETQRTDRVALKLSCPRWFLCARYESCAPVSASMMALCCLLSSLELRLSSFSQYLSQDRGSLDCCRERSNLPTQCVDVAKPFDLSRF